METGGLEIIWVIQMRHDHGSDQSGNHGGGEKQSDSGYMLKVEPEEFQHELDVACVCERERGFRVDS